MIVKTFRVSVIVTVIALVLAFVYDSGTGLALAAILAVLEVSLSFDNAVVNARILVRMSDFWQKIFLSVGVIIAVVGMRLVFPLLIVGITASLSPVEAVRLALKKGDVDTPGSYGYLLHDAHPAIAAFGGAFLLLLFLGFLFDEEREVQWLTWVERPLAKIGRLDALGVVVTLLVIVGAAKAFAPDGKEETVLVSGVLGTVTYLVVSALGNLFDTEEEADDDDENVRHTGDGRRLVLQTGKAAFFSFLYLEVLDASFSFDGVVGAFAITSDPIIIAIGLGIGALFIRSLTVYLVKTGTLAKFIYLEHGALWAIGALAVLLFVSIEHEVPEVVTGLIGAGFIAVALLSSVLHQRNHPEDAELETAVPAVSHS
jgi:hypothetical protein